MTLAPDLSAATGPWPAAAGGGDGADHGGPRQLPSWTTRVPTTIVVVAQAALLATLYALGALLPFWFLNTPEAGSAFFPSAGVTLAFLLLTPARRWPVWAAVIFAAELAIDMHEGLPRALSIGFALANTVEPLVGATLMRGAARRWKISQPLRHQLAAYIATAVVAGPAVGAAVGTVTSTVWGHNHSLYTLAWHWWLGDALGVLVVATAILTWARRSPYEAQARLWEVAAMVVIATGVTVVPAVLWDNPMVYAVEPVLVWAALRGGSRAVSAAGVGIAFAADWAAVTGRADELIGPGSTASRLAYVQVFLSVTLLTALLLAAEVGDRNRAEKRILTAEANRNRAERLAVEAAQTERRRIARETHDIVGHALNVILLQAGAARRVVADDPSLTKDFLESIEAVGRNAFRDLDVTLAVVDSSADLLPGRGLASVPSLVDVLRDAGMHIDLTIAGEPGDTSTLVDWSAYRIIQEALTNVAKHAPASTAAVTIHYEVDSVSLSVVDDGDGKTAEAAPLRQGRGLIGMQERVTFLSGQLDVGPQGATGFAVRAQLPRHS